MNNDIAYLLVGLSASVPLSILANILTPRFQQWLALRSESKAQRRIADLRQELHHVQELSSDPSRLQVYLLESILRIIMLSSFVVASSGFFFLLNYLLFPHLYFTLAGFTSMVIGGLFVFQECLRTFRTSLNVRYYALFHSRTEKSINELLAPAKDA